MKIPTKSQREQEVERLLEIYRGAGFDVHLTQPSEHEDDMLWFSLDVLFGDIGVVGPYRSSDEPECDYSYPAYLDAVAVGLRHIARVFSTIGDREHNVELSAAALELTRRIRQMDRPESPFADLTLE